MIVVGTAGHIDHGKSAIVRRLTGTNPDRLPEEKARGLTIDLGFAFYDTPGGDVIGFVDVPGHERFVRNMISGAGGIDVVGLVVAADDGWMPQSREHFEIVRLLGIRHGFIIVNKIDLVEREWMELLIEDIREKVAGSFLEGAPVFPVSATTGAGFDPLRRFLDELPQTVSSRSDIGKARLYIDRSFVRPGIGGVVTGTLRGGTLSAGQTVTVWPARRQAKVRTLQTHNTDVTEAAPGQRTAVSFTGIDKELLIRGGVITDRTDVELFVEHPVLAMDLEILPDSPITITDRRRVLFIVGTSEAEGELRLFRKVRIKPGERGVAFFRPDEPVYSHVGDRGIIRLITPMVTLGGARVLDHLPHFPRRKSHADYDYLLDRVKEGAGPLITSELRKRPMAARSLLLREADLDAREIESAVNDMIAGGSLAEFAGFVYDPQRVGTFVERLLAILKQWADDNPHVRRIPPDAIVRLSPYDERTTQILLDYMASQNLITREGEHFALAGPESELKGVIREAYEDIMKSIKEAPYTPPRLTELAARGKVHQKAIRYIIDSGQVYKCGSEFLFRQDAWQDMVAFIRDRIARDGRMAIGDFRDRFSFTRKYAIPVLEETDRLGLTSREGDYRVKGDRFDATNSVV